MKDKLTKLNEFLTDKFAFLNKKLKSKNSFIYYIVVISTVVLYTFFFNSNTVFSNKGGADYTTPLFEAKQVNNCKVELRSRKYDEKKHLVEFYVYSSDATDLSNPTLDFDLKEINNPMENIKLNIRRLDKNNYVVRANVPKKISVLSLGVATFNPLYASIEGGKDKEKSSNNELKNSVKFYSEYDDLEKVNDLKEKTSNQYLAEGATYEIRSLNKKIEENKKTIDEKNTLIDKYKENINRLYEDKNYQTETEKQDTDTKIKSIENIIKNEKDNINKLVKDNEELQQKSKKLSQKIRELSRK
ncbi:coiled-coil domain-containing protein [Paraclostridium sordellii]|uniref:coiled-coil domain-containing protein n=1 Tax=Paraclostridium sordellii TaxID=1505 RepID=UPI00038660FE|nr:hypothetical protein [Paeniclostridium sordellii]AUO31640.1 hypothetical protein [Paeniclostridium sordellii]AUO31734.1 hypothetical protein [Paeniclostridium sordellii]EPZ61111.1 hypothetical protein H476_0307 [[Clostridium] sordellii VPI 9048] [Paeniclostridium sordellii VPI 9048]CEK40082.1 hypothetical protein JGS6382_PCS1300411 (plasmid) [[Clostridium] sordellii] [Paeniclostridium sordellii]